MDDVAFLRRTSVGLSVVLLAISFYASGTSMIHIAIMNALMFMALVWFGTFLSNNGKIMATGVLVLIFAAMTFFASMLYAVHG